VKAGTRLLLLCTDSTSTRLLYNAVEQQFGWCGVVVEQRVSSKHLLRGRLRKLGARVVANQMAFQLAVQKPLAWLARPRVKELIAESGLSDSPISERHRTDVASINSPEVPALLAELKPDLIVVHGTRIIARALLSVLPCPIVNLHAGITPRYRGVHGGYWALHEGRPELCGSTLHLVDAGIDTGKVLEQRTFRPGPDDHFGVYPTLHAATSSRLLVDWLSQWDGSPPRVTEPMSDPAPLRYHPGLSQYLMGWWLYGVK